MTRRIPLFPLSTVLFPGLILPLHIFEPRYRGLVQRLMDEPDGSPREFGVVAIREGHEVGAGEARDLHPVGCVADLREVEPYDDGRFDITTVGIRRFRIVSLDTSEPLWTAEVEDLAEELGAEPDDLDLLVHAVVREFARYRAALAGAPAELDDQARSGLEADDGNGNGTAMPTEPGVLSYAVAAAMILATGDKQQLLAAPNVAARLREERRLLAHERALIRAVPSLPAVNLARPSPSTN